VSGILFGLDMFSMEKALALITVSEGIILTGIRRRKVQKQGFDVREYFFPVILVICMLPFVWNKFGFYGMGQDEGVYQTQAIAFMNGNYGNQKELSEYETLDEAGREDYRQFVDSKLVGFYVYDASLPSLPEEERLSGVSGFYHGIPTFSAVLEWERCRNRIRLSDDSYFFFLPFDDIYGDSGFPFGFLGNVFTYGKKRIYPCGNCEPCYFRYIHDWHCKNSGNV